ncbi:hypothetical protein CSKR_200273 [Clonorchis sinensis]|uniref:Uncharacterized protein n=1 Tax=Clonorchis sinensis TaxID=79923 RepID=A0A8T1M0Q6_CLOSI|nr:hypothetical protein CSKR_200273 [Clonorchis sinensis]
MGTVCAFISIVLMGSVLTRSIPPYDLCMDECGEDPPHVDPEEIHRVEWCRHRCNAEERTRCLDANADNEREKINCWRESLFRCFARCGKIQQCLRICQQLHAPPTPIFDTKRMIHSKPVCIFG